MKQILVAVDTLRTADDLVGAGRSYGEAFGAKLWIVHVAAPDPAFVGYGAGPQTVRDARAEELRSEHQALLKIVAELRTRGLNAEARLLSGETVAVLLSEADRVCADLIILRRLRRGRLSLAIVGSVCQSMIRKAKCPVLILPASLDA